MKNTQAKICRYLVSKDWSNKDMSEKKCYSCGCGPLSKDEIGLTKKLINKKSTYFFCMSCLAENLEVTTEELLAKIEEFKEEGCTLFK